MQHRGYDLVLIRHAESEFNRVTFEEAENLGMKGRRWDELIKFDEFKRRVVYNQELLDAPLSEHGKEQVIVR
jgi:broad specificity phosphatase PhoE